MAPAVRAFWRECCGEQLTLGLPTACSVRRSHIRLPPRWPCLNLHSVLSCLGVAIDCGACTALAARRRYDRCMLCVADLRTRATNAFGADRLIAPLGQALFGVPMSARTAAGLDDVASASSGARSSSAALFGRLRSFLCSIEQLLLRGTIYLTPALRIGSDFRIFVTFSGKS